MIFYFDPATKSMFDEGNNMISLQEMLELSTTTPTPGSYPIFVSDSNDGSVKGANHATWDLISGRNAVGYGVDMPKAYAGTYQPSKERVIWQWHVRDAPGDVPGYGMICHKVVEDEAKWAKEWRNESTAFSGSESELRKWIMRGSLLEPTTEEVEQTQTPCTPESYVQDLKEDELAAKEMVDRLYSSFDLLDIIEADYELGFPGHGRWTAAELVAVENLLIGRANHDMQMRDVDGACEGKWEKLEALQAAVVEPPPVPTKPATGLFSVAPMCRVGGSMWGAESP